MREGAGVEGWPARLNRPLFAMLTDSELHRDNLYFGRIIKISFVSENDLFFFRSSYPLSVCPSLQELGPGWIPGLSTLLFCCGFSFLAPRVVQSLPSGRMCPRPPGPSQDYSAPQRSWQGAQADVCCMSLPRTPCFWRSHSYLQYSVWGFFDLEEKFKFHFCLLTKKASLVHFSESQLLDL